MPGHLFVIDGDLTKLACDALLIPTDGRIDITPSWRQFLSGKRYPGHFETRVMQALPAPDREPHVWLGDVAGPGLASTFDRTEEVLREYVDRAVAALTLLDDSQRSYPWPKYRLAVNVIGSGLGGAAAVKGELLCRIIELLERLADEHDVDIVLVTYGAKAYAAAQRARRRTVDMAFLTSTWRFHQRSSPDLEQWARTLADEAITSRLVLFVGAGVSAGAGLPTWNALLAGVAAEAGFSPEALKLLAHKDPRDQATLIDRRLQATGRELRAAVAETLQRTTRYSLQHGLLTSLPSSEAVTTNFDSLFEQAATTADRALAVLPEHPQSADGRWLLKLHGSVEQPSGIILTRSDFLAMPRQYGALIGLVQGLLLMRHMMFVGYSLQDEDFQELIHEVRAARGDGPVGGRGTVLTLFEDELEREIWQDDLDVVPMMTGDFTSDLVPVAARELEVFLDLVGFLSTTSAAFFLDETYGYLSDDESELRRTLGELAAQTTDAEKGSVGYLVRRFLAGLGSEDT